MARAFVCARESEGDDESPYNQTITETRLANQRLSRLKEGETSATMAGEREYVG